MIPLYCASRTFNLKFSLQPHPKYYITQNEELFIADSDERSLHFSPPHLYIALWKVWECTCFRTWYEVCNNFSFLAGPRFVLNLVKIFEGSFGGPTLFDNPHYQSPNQVSSFLLSVEGRLMPVGPPGRGHVITPGLSCSCMKILHLDPWSEVIECSHHNPACVPPGGTPIWKGRGCSSSCLGVKISGSGTT